MGIMVKALLLDLDNTLYPESSAMGEGFTRRVKAFVAGFLGVGEDEAARLREENLKRYGTTLEWLQRGCGLADDDAYFAAIHPECEADEVPKDPRLRPFLLSLNLPLILLTNAPYFHAERILRHLDAFDIFFRIYDLTWNGGRGKPYPESYINPLADAGFAPQDALFADDSLKYALGYKAVGGTPVLVDQTGARAAAAAKEGIASIRSIYELPATGLLR